MNTTTIIVLVLLAIIQIILILSVVHISAKTDEMSSTLKEINARKDHVQHRQKGLTMSHLSPVQHYLPNGENYISKIIHRT